MLIFNMQIFGTIKYYACKGEYMDLPLDENRGRLSYWLFYAQRCVAYAYAEVLRAHCEERGISR